MILLMAYALYQLLPSTGGKSASERDSAPGDRPSKPSVVNTQYEASQSTASGDPDAAATDTTSPVQRTRSEPQLETAIREGVLTVVIMEYDYLLPIRSVDRTIDEQVEYRTVEIADVVRLAGEATGNENGLRVRVLRHRTSRASAEQQLLSALAAAEITGDAVYMASELRD
jgi:hypothetical protein